MTRNLILAAYALLICALAIGSVMFRQSCTKIQTPFFTVGNDRWDAVVQMAVPDAAERQQELQEEWEDCFDADPVTRESAMCRVIREENL